jgi:uncharacterized membrane protein (DUF4010 family)
MLVRVTIAIGLLNPSLLKLAIGPLLACTISSIVCATILHRTAGTAAASAAVSYRNPFSILAAIRFGVLLTVIMFVAKFAQVRFQDAGVLAAAALSGTVDVDPITVTAAKLSLGGEISERLALIAIGVAIFVNTIAKATVAAVAGSRELRAALVPTVVATLGAGALAILFVLGL